MIPSRSLPPTPMNQEERDFVKFMRLEEELKKLQQTKKN